MESSEVERELEELETRIERLRALYEQYFMGIERLEPLIPRKDVDRRIWVLRREQIRNTGLRFKFQMLLQRYNTFQQYWGRIAREIENGTYRRDVMRAAKRFGAQEALTIVGRKRAERYAALAEQQSAARDTVRQEAADDHGDEMEVDDQAVTLAPPPGRAASSRDLADVADVAMFAAPAPVALDPAPPAAPQAPPLVALPPPPTPQASAPVKPAPLGGLPWGLGLPKPQQPKPADASAPPPLGGTPHSRVPPPGQKPPARPPAGQPAQPGAAGPPGRSRVAELAAEMRAQRAHGARDGGGGTAFESSPGGVVEAKPAEAPPAKPARSPSVRPRPEPRGAAPSGQPEAVGARSPGTTPRAGAGAPNLGTTPRVGASAEAPARAGSGPMRAEGPAKTEPRPMPAGETASSRRRRSTAPPSDDAEAASGIRHPTSRRSSRPPRAAVDAARSGPDTGLRVRPGPGGPRAAGREDDLPEHRLRQIYTKYVETKRAANESTAGVTYERLAESLREQAAKLRATNPAKSIDYDVVVKNGKTLLKPILK